MDIETDIEDDELLEIHAAEVVRQALWRENARRENARLDTPVKGNLRLVGIFEGVDAHLETWVLKE